MGPWSEIGSREPGLATLSSVRTVEPVSASEWWRTAVIYQIYPRSFADSNGDGIGDLPGVAHRLPTIKELGADAVWLSPFYPSPQRDAGYDVADYCGVDPLFGTMDDFDHLLAETHRLGMRMIIDLVPNHTSSDHEWFQDALNSPPGSEARDHYMFHDGKGDDGEEPPNNWQSVFGGPAWTRVINEDGTPGQWYLHLFDTSQPDLNWRSEWVREQFRDILRFWLDKGVDGFRVDVAHGLIKAPGLPDYTPPIDSGSMGGGTSAMDDAGVADTIESEGDHAYAHPHDAPYWGRPGVHEIYRDWHKLLAEYDGDRALCGEAWVNPLSKLALWVRPDEMQQTFNFTYLETPWEAEKLRRVIRDSLAAFGSVGAPSTWVLSNHDVVRHPTRLVLAEYHHQGDGIGPRNADLVGDPVVGLRRARAATSLMLALPGSAYLYQGEELGLPEVVYLPDPSRQDPTWFRTAGRRYGRDGCRVPIPWEPTGHSYGFNETGLSWLPQPDDWAPYARESQGGQPASTLALYTRLLTERRERGMALGELEWLNGYGDDIVAFRNAGITVIANMGAESIPLPAGDIIVSNEPLDGTELPAATTAWIA